MKRLSSLFAFVIICIGQTFAVGTSTRVLGPDDIRTDKAYIIYTAECGGLTVSKSNATEMSSTKENHTNHAINKGNKYQQFAFVNRGDDYYLYSIGAQRFVGTEGLSKDALDAIHFADADTSTVRLFFDATHNINLYGWTYSYNCNSETLKSAANSFIIEEAADFDQSKLAEAISNDNFVCLNSHSLSLSRYGSQQLSTTRPIEVIWKSSNPSVATVDNNGLVQGAGVEKGATLITAESTVDPSLKDTCVVFVATYSSWSIPRLTIDGIQYEIPGTDITVMGNPSDRCTGDIIIPSTIDYEGVTLNVKSIEEYAFDGYAGLTSVTVSEGVTSIGYAAFRSCSKMAAISLPNSLTNMADAVFDGCSSLATVNIGDGVIDIGNFAFSGCSSLVSIHIPNSATSIGNSAFFRCKGLTSLELPQGVTSIGEDAFYDCESLKSVEMPNSVASIGRSAFSGCKELTAIDIPDNVKSIEEWTFQSCSKLESIRIPPNLTSIGNNSFNYCGRIKYFYIDDIGAWCRISGLANMMSKAYDTSTLYVNGEEIEDLIIPEGITAIPQKAFSGFDHIRNITIPNTLLNIEESAFYWYKDNIPVSIYISDLASWCKISGLRHLMSAHQLSNTLYLNGEEVEEAVIPEGPTSISDGAFYKLQNLRKISIPNSVTSIGNYAFKGCNNLETIAIPDMVTNIGQGSFDGCSSLEAIVIPDKVTSIEQDSFWGCSSLASVTIPAGVTNIGVNAFRDCGLTSVNISDIAAWCRISGLNNLMSYGKSTKTLYVNGEEIEDLIIPEGITAIQDYAFANFQNIKTITIPNSVISIGERAFYSCSSLISAAIGEKVTSIGKYAFENCHKLTSINIPKNLKSLESDSFRSCHDLSSINIADVGVWCQISGLENLITNGASDKILYLNGEELENLVIPEEMTAIPDYAFKNFKNIRSATIPVSVRAIGKNAFSGCSCLTEISFASTTPAGVSNSFENQTTLIVPDEAYNDYVEAWPSYAKKITLGGQYDREIFVESNDIESAIHRAVGEKNLRHVIRLKVTGSINGYDIMVLRNKMINLHHLDLSEATIQSNDYEYYTGYHTTDNEIGAYAFYNLPNLVSIKLPNVTAIGEYAFGNCTNLHEINIPESVTTLSSHAFSSCSTLQTIEIPGSISTISPYAFSGCRKLENVTFHEGLETIESYAFYCCTIKRLIFPESLKEIEEYAFCVGGTGVHNQFEELNLPPNLNTIGQYAFEGCTSLKVVRLNPMLKNISDYAFTGCSALNKVYTYIVEPTDILQNTFSTYKTADLYVPSPSYYTYYINTQWSQFLSVNKSDEEYDFKSFYINKDYVMDDDSGILGGDPDAELNENSGLVNESSETQELGTVTMRFNGNNGSASIIANGNLTAEKINVEITITGNKWHFFCFPFDVPLSGVKVSGNKAYVFRHYNAAKRATGASGWEGLPTDQTVLQAGEGYIFQANGNSTLTVTVDNKTTFVGENVATALHVQDASNVANASWNFKGNPGYTYFDIDELGFSAPITVWDPNTNSYVALRPGDDDAFLHPFQAFFVQKPEGTDALTFNAEDRTTYLGSQKKMKNKVERRLAANADSPRKLINLSVTDGTNTDKTRIVFNDEKSMAYEMDCDAAKFAATGVPQLYSLDDANNKYAINERPNGDGTVRLGFTADKSGHFTFEAPRMDTPCYLRDLVKGTTHDFNVGAYEFDSEKGDFNNRFVLVNTLVAEGIEEHLADQKSPFKGDLEGLYDLQGRRQQKAERNLYIINGKKKNVK